MKWVLFETHDQAVYLKEILLNFVENGPISLQILLCKAFPLNSKSLFVCSEQLELTRFREKRMVIIPHDVQNDTEIVVFFFFMSSLFFF
jgi:hypothetical protein